MNWISVCVAVGAFAFARSHSGHDSRMTAEWNPKGNEFVESGPETGIGGPAEESSANVNEVCRDFCRLKNIYEECKTKMNKRLKKFIKTRVSSSLGELKSYVSSLYRCVKVYGFRALDDILEKDSIQVSEHAFFVKDGIGGPEEASSEKSAVPLRVYAARVLAQDSTALLLDRLLSLFRSHSLKFNFDGSLLFRGRGRRRDHRMFAMMVMGFMIMASILIPMGFQFLTVLGGKSLLLAKMALIMSAINGLKKIATSNVGYGFYHSGADAHHHDHLHHGFHEKQYQLPPHNFNNVQGYN